MALSHRPKHYVSFRGGRSVYDEVVMRIAKGQIVAGYPAVIVRGFLRRCRFGITLPTNAAHDLKIDESEGAVLLRKLASLGLVEAAEHMPRGEADAYELTSRGHAFANATAARPVLRKTAERTLSQFMERLRTVNSTPEYLCRVESAVLFGSLLSKAERLGDVDIAVELSPKITDQTAIHRWGNQRRRAAQEQGQEFRSDFDWAFRPKEEVFHVLRARSRILSLHGLHELGEMMDL